MSNIRFVYLYRDGANYKCWGKVVFKNPDELNIREIEDKLLFAFLPDKLFIASQVTVPEEFLFLDGKFTKYDHCYHEFDCVETTNDKPSDRLGRSIADFLRDVEAIANQGWNAFDILDRA